MGDAAQRASDLPHSWAIAAILVLGFTVCVAVNWPGHINYDSAVQLAEGRAGQYQNWHPAIMSWMLGVTDAAVPGVCLFVVFDTLLLYGSVLSLLWLAPKPSRFAAALALLCILTPQFAIYPGVAWKDVLFSGAGVASFVCLAHGAARWDNRQCRYALLAASWAFAALAALARQNGVVVIAFAAIAAGWIAMRHEKARVVGFRYGFGILALTACLAALVFAALSLRFEPGYDATADQIKQQRVFDLVGAAVLRPDLPLDWIRAASPAFERRIHTQGVQLYRAASHDSIADAPGFNVALDTVDDDVITRQWLDLVEQHPGLYLRLRAETFRWVVLTPDPNVCPPLEVGVWAPAAILKGLGMPARKDARDQSLGDYAFRLSGTPVGSHLTYIILGCGALIVLLRRRRPADLAIACMLAASLAYMASFFVISIACDYRYLLFVDVAAMTAILYLALTMSPRRG